MSIPQTGQLMAPRPKHNAIFQFEPFHRDWQPQLDTVKRWRPYLCDEHDIHVERLGAVIGFSPLSLFTSSPQGIFSAFQHGTSWVLEHGRSNTELAYLHTLWILEHLSHITSCTTQNSVQPEALGCRPLVVLELEPVFPELREQRLSLRAEVMKHRLREYRLAVDETCTLTVIAPYPFSVTQPPRLAYVLGEPTMFASYSMLADLIARIVVAQTSASSTITPGRGKRGREASEGLADLSRRRDMAEGHVFPSEGGEHGMPQRVSVAGVSREGDAVARASSPRVRSPGSDTLSSNDLQLFRLPRLVFPPERSAHTRATFDRDPLSRAWPVDTGARLNPPRESPVGARSLVLSPSFSSDFASNAEKISVRSLLSTDQETPEPVLSQPGYPALPQAKAQGGSDPDRGDDTAMLPRSDEPPPLERTLPARFGTARSQSIDIRTMPGRSTASRQERPTSVRRGVRVPHEAPVQSPMPSTIVRRAATTDSDCQESRNIKWAELVNEQKPYLDAHFGRVMYSGRADLQLARGLYEKAVGATFFGAEFANDLLRLCGAARDATEKCAARARDDGAFGAPDGALLTASFDSVNGCANHYFLTMGEISADRPGTIVLLAKERYGDPFWRTHLLREPSSDDIRRMSKHFDALYPSSRS